MWEAYNSDKLHWYVPDEIGDLDKAAGNNPEQMREQIGQMMAFAETKTRARRSSQAPILTLYIH